MTQGHKVKDGRIPEAVAILNTLVLDTLVGLRSLDLFSAIDDRTPFSDSMRAGFTRLSTTQLVLALAKWMEFYERYKGLIPPTFAFAARDLYRELKSRGVRDFRNKVIGHIWDKESSKPLTEDEVHERLAKIVGTDEGAFNRWIYDPAAPDRTVHVVGLTEQIRDALRSRGGPTN